MRKSTGEMNAGSAPNAGRDARDAALKKKAKTSDTRRDSRVKMALYTDPQPDFCIHKLVKLGLLSTSLCSYLVFDLSG